MPSFMYFMIAEPSSEVRSDWIAGGDLMDESEPNILGWISQSLNLVAASADQQLTKIMSS